MEGENYMYKWTPLSLFLMASVVTNDVVNGLCTSGSSVC